jgi:dTDP-4-amino-4,6-dideoxygalactose transaminase
MTATSKIPFVDLQAQYQTIAPEIDAAIQGVLDRSDYILGDEVRLFEDEYAKYIGTAHALSVGSGLDALELALRAYGIGPGDEVITAANTFIATALAIIAVGGNGSSYVQHCPCSHRGGHHFAHARDYARAPVWSAR